MKAEAAAAPRVRGLCAVLRRAALLYEHYGERADEREEHRDAEGRAVAEQPVGEDAERGSQRHRERVHRAVEPHARAYLVARQKVRHPCRHADRAAGEADAVEDAEGRHDARVEREHIAEAGRGHHPRSRYRKAALVDFVREVAREGTAEMRAEVHHAADEPHQSGGSAERAGKSRNYRRDEHRARKVEKASPENKKNIP